jgi:putative ABC transport system ATP-binding protein
MIDLRQVVKTYQNGAGTFAALGGVDLQIRTGEFVAVTGKSGSGKSTLLNMISGIDKPTSGEVWIDGVAIQALRQGQITAWRGRTVGIIFQFFQLLPTMTVLENVMLPMDLCQTFPSRERRGRALHLLEQVGMAEHMARLPSALSGGQQQRVAIARALANDPPLILADEPTGNLDSETAKSVLRLFEDMVQNGKTILMVTHDTDLAVNAGHILVMVDGQIAENIVHAPVSTGWLQQIPLETRHA